MTDLLTRKATLGPTTLTDGGTIEAVITTSADYDRPQFTERLDTAGVDLTRLDGAPLLDSHSQTGTDKILGVVLSHRTEGNAIIAVIQLSNAPDVASQVMKIREGVIRYLSIGYVVTRWARSNDPKTGKVIRTALAWQIREVSAVSVPADHGAKFRSEDRNDQMPKDTYDSTELNRADLVESLRSVCDLADDWGTDLIDSGDTADQIRDAARADMAKRNAPRVRVGTSHDDPALITRRQSAAIAYRMAGGDLPDDAREYVGMTVKESLVDSLTRAGVSTRGMSTDEMLTRSLTTSDFPLTVSNAMGKVALDTYKAAESPLKALCRQRTLPNFKDSTSIRLGEMGRLEPLSESGEFTHTTRAENGESMRVKTYGRAITLSRELIINDDLNLLGDMTAALGEAAAQTEADELVKLVIGGGYKMSDGKSPFHATRGNLSGTGTSIGSAGDLGALDEARQSMRTLKGLDGKTIIDAKPVYLLVGPELETDAEALMAKIYPASKDDANVFASRLKLIVEHRIEGKGWWLFADPVRVPAMQFAYLQSAQGVQIQRAEAWDTLGLKFRAYLDFGCGWLDWRGAYHNPGDA
jgi:hypothetical protein